VAFLEKIELDITETCEVVLHKQPRSNKAMGKAAGLALKYHNKAIKIIQYLSISATMSSNITH
jgi:hypothetical protein